MLLSYVYSILISLAVIFVNNLLLEFLITKLVEYLHIKFIITILLDIFSFNITIKFILFDK